MPRTSTRSLVYGPARRGVTAVDGGFMRNAALIVALLVSLACRADESPLTRAESSNYSATSRCTDVMAFIHPLQRQSAKLCLKTLDTSAERNNIPLLFADAADIGR